MFGFIIRYAYIYILYVVIMGPGGIKKLQIIHIEDGWRMDCPIIENYKMCILVCNTENI